MTLTSRFCLANQKHHQSDLQTNDSDELVSFIDSKTDNASSPVDKQRTFMTRFFLVNQKPTVGSLDESFNTLVSDSV